MTDEQDELIRSLNLKVLKLELKAGKNMTIKYLEDEERESKTKSGAVKLTT